MGIREKINQNRSVVMAISVIAFIVAIVTIWLNTNNRPGYATQTFYSVDDGASYFRDDNTLVPPFDRGGKLAYKVHIFRCVNDGEEWVAYLEGYRPEARAKAIELKEMMDKLAKDPNASPPPPNKDPMYLLPALQAKGLVVKRPGDPASKWVSENDGEAYGQTKQAKCPHDPSHDLIEVLP